MRVVDGQHRQTTNKRPKLYGWQDGSSFCLSSMKEGRIVHGTPYRPFKRFATRAEAEAEAATRGRPIEWQ